MTVRMAERRRSPRVCAAHRARITDSSGHLIVHGRTANISQNGAMVICHTRGYPEPPPSVLVELELPGASDKDSPDGNERTVTFDCRVVRTRRLGHLVGLGVEFPQRRKLSRNLPLRP